ncbi:hypothetical protein [Desulfonema limicola]|uniref:hypothetical protein n=1 Tax=Desulfonema limicola TaxID=45656 RepID=UPI001A9B7CF3|nr:hypothetical protein [Desulfonema limicola]
MAIVKRVKEYYQEKPSRINQEDFSIINLTVCDRCGKEKPRNQRRAGVFEGLAWLSLTVSGPDICPDCIKSEYEKKRVTSQLNSELEWTNLAIKNCKTRIESSKQNMKIWQEHKEKVQELKNNYI